MDWIKEEQGGKCLNLPFEYRYKKEGRVAGRLGIDGTYCLVGMRVVNRTSSR